MTSLKERIAQFQGKTITDEILLKSPYSKTVSREELINREKEAVEIIQLQQEIIEMLCKKIRGEIAEYNFQGHIGIGVLQEALDKTNKLMENDQSKNSA